MPCSPLDPLSCATGAVGAVVGSAATAASVTLGNSFADAMRDGAAWVISTTIGWWLEVPSIDLTSSPAVNIRGYVWWLALVVAAAGAIWQGLRMAITHRSDPLLDVGRGLVTLALWAGIGIAGPAAALEAGDAFSVWILDTAARGQISDRLISLASLTTVNSAGAVILLGLLVMLTGLAQATLMLFREGAVVVLAGVIVLAAAGNMTGFGRPWLTKVLGWMLALIAFKPVAALVYATSLAMTGESDDPRTIVVGISMMVLAIATLPALMKFFSWATGSTGHGGGELAAALRLGAAGARSAGALRSRSGAASEPDGGPSAAGSQAASISRDLRGTTASGSAAAPGSTGAASAGASTVASSSTAGAAAGGVAGMAVAVVASEGVRQGKRAARTATSAMTGDPHSTHPTTGTDRSA